MHANTSASTQQQPAFDYTEAFSRNLGWVTPQEQTALQKKCVAIAGLGGIGGWNVLALARLGVSRFHLADFDTFNLVNFNRQAGANMSTLHQPKVDVIAKMILDINPNAELKLFPQGVTPDNVTAFLHGADVYLDAIDFFCFEARMRMHQTCQQLRIPAVVTVPLGMGAAVMNFLPGKMTFEDYFQWTNQTDQERALRFLVGISPRLPQRSYLADDSYVNLQEQRGPSTSMACLLGSGAAITEVLKILTGRGKILAAPHSYQFDAYKLRFIKSWRPCGVANPLVRIMLWIARARLKR